MAVITTYTAECDVCKKTEPVGMDDRAVAGHVVHPKGWKEIVVCGGVEVTVCSKDCARTFVLREIERLFPATPTTSDVRPKTGPYR